MPATNVIHVDFCPRARNVDPEELCERLDGIDLALAAAHATARELQAELSACGDALERCGPAAVERTLQGPDVVFARGDGKRPLHRSPGFPAEAARSLGGPQHLKHRG